ncbi:MAG: hypothetical protein OEN20_00840, partial [Gammaproteobacteria bacterium]|nr:hypothetical protein [Gammaproteobacteria bacterium]
MPEHKGWKSELSVLKLVNRRLVRLRLAELQAKDLAGCRDRRLSEVGPQTTKHAFSVANRVLVQAIQERGYVLRL